MSVDLLELFNYVRFSSLNSSTLDLAFDVKNKYISNNIIDDIKFLGTRKDYDSQNESIAVSINLRFYLIVYILTKIIDDKRLFETSIVYNNIQKVLANLNLNPKKYFPEVFFLLYNKILRHISSLDKNINDLSDIDQWHVSKKCMK
jgi:hypothetical protein